MKLLPSFITNLFKPRESLIPASPSSGNLPLFSKHTESKRVRHLWLDRTMEQVKGSGTVLIEYPKQLSGKVAQRLVCQRLILRFGKGGYSTHLMPRLSQIRITVKS